MDKVGSTPIGPVTGSDKRILFYF